jgi:hypothetical protein
MSHQQGHLPPIPTYATWLDDRNPDDIRDTHKLMAWTYLTFANALQDLIRTLGKRLEAIGAKMTNAGNLMKELNTGEAAVIAPNAWKLLIGTEADSRKKMQDFIDAGTGPEHLVVEQEKDAAGNFTGVWHVHAYKEGMKTMAENLQTTITNDSSMSQQLQLLLSQLNSRFTNSMENVSQQIKKFESQGETTVTNYRR